MATTECLPKKPVKTSLFLRFRANLMAYLERADSAPLGKSKFLTGNGGGGARAIASNANGASVTIYANAPVNFRVSDDGGSSWTNFAGSISVTNTVDVSITMELDWTTGEFEVIQRAVGHDGIGNLVTSIDATTGTNATVAAMGTIDAVSVSSGGAASDVRFMARLHGGWA